MARLWKKAKPPTLPKTPTNYPHGTCVHTEAGYFLIRETKRYHLPTKRIVDSWGFHRIVPTTEAAVKHYRVAAKVGFRDGSLIYNLGDGKIYLISNNERRHIKSPEALELVGARITDPVLVSVYEANLQRQGADLE
jgi:hypothetical protein